MRSILFVVLLVLATSSATLRAEHSSRERMHLLQEDDTQSAALRGKQLVTALSEKFRAMKSYKVAFMVESDNKKINGNYAVEGDAYTLMVGSSEVFCDGVLRHEVDTQRKEITLDKVDLANRNILSNPVRAFDFLDSDYSARLLWERDGKVAVSLTSQKNRNSGTITVTIVVGTMLPSELLYDFDGERIRVVVESVTAQTTPLVRFDRANFPNYELIDFR